MDIRDQEELRRVVREIVEEEIRVYMFYNGKDVISDVVDECLKENKESENNGADTDSKENMEKIIAQLKEKNRTLESENEVLKNHIAGIKCEKNRLVTEFESNRENLKDEFGERHQMLEEKIAQQNSLINDLHSEIAKYKLGNANFENRLDELQCELREREVELANREKTIEALKCELEDREEKTKALECGLRDREEMIEALKCKLANREEKTKALECELVNSKNELRAKCREAEELKVEVTECKEKLQMRSCEIAELKSESKKLCAVIEELKHALTNKISEIRAYEQKIVVKDRMISDCKKTIDEKDNEIFKNKEEILMKENMLSNCKKELKETQEKAYKYSRELADQGELTKIADLYKRYMKVSEKTKEGLKNLIRCKDISTFASCGYNIQTLDNLWEYVNQEIRYGHSIELDILRDFFIYFMEQQNKQYESQVYGVVVPEIKEYFDPTRHTDVDGNSADEVKEVLFPGYGYVQKQTGTDQKKGKVKFRNIKKLAIVRTK